MVNDTPYKVETGGRPIQNLACGSWHVAAISGQPGKYNDHFLHVFQNVVDRTRDVTFFNIFLKK